MFARFCRSDEGMMESTWPIADKISLRKNFLPAAAGVNVS